VFLLIIVMLWLPRALKVLSDQVESEETQLRVTAQASTSWGLIGFGVAGVAIVSLVIVFMKFKRR
jgi:uncharacterized membrane protein